jgi:hypothetical protein
MRERGRSLVEVEICGNGVRRGKGVPTRLACERCVVGVKQMPTDHWSTHGRLGLKTVWPFACFTRDVNLALDSQEHILGKALVGVVLTVWSNLDGVGDSALLLLIQVVNRQSCEPCYVPIGLGSESNLGPPPVIGRPRSYHTSSRRRFFIRAPPLFKNQPVVQPTMLCV